MTDQIQQTPPPTVQTQPLEFKDFSGGITDFYLGCPLNKYQKGDNLLIQDYSGTGKLYTRPGSQIHDATYYQIPAGAQRLGQFKYYQSILFQQSSRNMYFISTGWNTLLGPTGNKLFPVGVDTTTVASMTTWNQHLFVCSDAFTKPQKIYMDNSSTWQLRTAGMPKLASSPTVTPSGGTGHSYLYRFIYAYTYTVGAGAVTFVNRGTAVEVASGDTGTPNANNVAIAAIPVLANTTVDNYDTSNVKVEIYRTSDGGSNFFFLAQVTNGTTTYTDSTTDATLQNNVPLYTEGGFPDNDTPPLSAVMHVVEDRCFYGNCKIGSVTYPNRIYQSIPGAIDSVPATFFHDCRDGIVAISSIRNLPIAIGTTDCYRLDDGISESGTGDITPVTLSTNAGCVSALSVVQTPEGVFWAGPDGFYFTDAYTTIRISKSIRLSYPLIVASAAQKRRIVGKYDANQRRIWWTFQSSGATDCDSCYILDLKFGISDDMPFTTASGGANFAPTCLEFIGTTLVRGDTRGYAFDHLTSIYTDPKVNTAAAPSTWQVATIIYDHISAATDFGSSFMRKWVTRCGVVCQNETDLSLQIISINDNGKKTGNLSPIRFRGNITWGDADVYWGDPSLVWGGQGLIDDMRRFPAQNLRCEYKQIELTNAKVALINSDTLGTVTVDASGKTATLNGTSIWPSNAVDYVIAFDRDNYTAEYVVTIRTDTVLTYSDAANTTANSSSAKWVIRGKLKGEVLNLLGYTLHYAPIGKTQDPYRLSGTGEVGSS